MILQTPHLTVVRASSVDGLNAEEASRDGLVTAAVSGIQFVCRRFFIACRQLSAVVAG